MGPIDTTGTSEIRITPGGPFPWAFEARTWNVYKYRFTRPVTVQVVVPAVEQLAPPCEAVTVYPVMWEPPSETGAVHDTTALPLPGVAVSAVGGPGFLIRGGLVELAVALAATVRTDTASRAGTQSLRTARLNPRKRPYV